VNIKWIACCTALLLLLPTGAYAAIIPPLLDPLPIDATGPIKPEADVIIDAGHGGIDGGTSHGELLEKHINLEIAKKVYQLFDSKGYDIVLNRTGDYALSDQNRWLRNRSRHIRDLAQRKQLVNEIKPKALVSLHVNWSKNKQTRGAIILHQSTEASFALASEIQARLNELYHTNEKPFYGKTYYLLNHSPCPTVIVEMGFISNVQDRARLTNARGQQEIAEAIVKGVEAYLKKIEPPTR